VRSGLCPAIVAWEAAAFVRVGLLPGVTYRFGKRCDTVKMQRSLAAGATALPAPVSVFGR
jgi:phosphinothricin acetyltransferase